MTRILELRRRPRARAGQQDRALLKLRRRCAPISDHDGGRAVRWLASTRLKTCVSPRPASGTAPCRFAHRQHRRMAQPPLDRNGEKPLADLQRPPQFDHLVLPHHLPHRGEGHREHPRARLAEGAHQRAVVEFADDGRLDSLAFEPAQQGRAQRAVLARDQQGRSMQIRWKILLERTGDRFCSQKGDATFAERVAVALDVHAEGRAGRPAPCRDDG
jgi:hypothetical protein